MSNFALALVMMFSVAACAQKNYGTSAAKDNKTQASNCPYVLPNLGICFDLAWASEPQSQTYTKFVLKTWSVATGAVTDVPGNLEVFLWMPAMGHGSAPVTLVKQEAGIWQVNQVYFTMPGEWQVVIQIKTSGQVIDKAAVPVSIL